MELRKARDRTRSALSEVFPIAHGNLSGAVATDFNFAIWSQSVAEAYQHQWSGEPRHSDAGWDWMEINSRYNDPKEVTVALKAGERLSCLSQLCYSRERVMVRFIEGDPRPDCPLKPARAIIMLDLAATFGQHQGCKEIHLYPINSRVKALYQGLGFFEGNDSTRQPVLKRLLS